MNKLFLTSEMIGDVLTLTLLRSSFSLEKWTNRMHASSKSSISFTISYKMIDAKHSDLTNITNVKTITQVNYQLN